MKQFNLCMTNILKKHGEKKSMEHDILWQAIEDIAKHNGLSCSGLAKKSGLDATTFNKSKKFSSDGTPRWPSCCTIAKIIRAMNITMYDFADFVHNAQTAKHPK